MHHRAFGKFFALVPVESISTWGLADGRENQESAILERTQSGNIEETNKLRKRVEAPGLG